MNCPVESTLNMSLPLAQTDKRQLVSSKLFSISSLEKDRHCYLCRTAK